MLSPRPRPHDLVTSQRPRLRTPPCCRRGAHTERPGDTNIRCVALGTAGRPPGKEGRRGGFCPRVSGRERPGHPCILDLRPPEHSCCVKLHSWRSFARRPWTWGRRGCVDVTAALPCSPRGPGALRHGLGHFSAQVACLLRGAEGRSLFPLPAAGRPVLITFRAGLSEARMLFLLWLFSGRRGRLRGETVSGQEGGVCNGWWQSFPTGPRLGWRRRGRSAGPPGRSGGGDPRRAPATVPLRRTRCACAWLCVVAWRSARLSYALGEQTAPRAASSRSLPPWSPVRPAPAGRSRGSVRGESSDAFPTGPPLPPQALPAPPLARKRHRDQGPVLDADRTEDTV